MRSYFKYTNGEAFTLDGQDYTGFLHISDDLPYTGKIDSDDMSLLVPKNTFMANFYLNQGNFNTTYRNVEPITPFFSNFNDLLNLQGTLTMLRHLNNQNLICFKNLILGHPIVYQFEKNNNFYYGLSAPNELPLRGKRSSADRDAIPFSQATGLFEPPPGSSGALTWKFLDDVTTGSFTVGEDENFVYFCSTGDSKLIALKGSFIDDGPLVYLDDKDFIILYGGSAGQPDNIYHVYNDEDIHQMFIVFNDTINVYDTSRFKDCQSLDSLALIDIIPIGSGTTLIVEHKWGTTETPFMSANFTFGTRSTTFNPNYPETVKVGNNLRTLFFNNALSCFNKYSDDLVLSMDLRTFGISALYSIDIRNTDDNILLFYKHTDNTLKLLHIDPELGTFDDHFIYSINDSDKFTVNFSGIDSDMFYLSNRNEYQTRFLSAPEWPCGRLEVGDLHYPTNYKWGQAKFLWGEFLVPFGNATSPANSFNNLVSSEIISNNKMYMLLHNIGRLYALNQPPPDRFLNALPLNTVSNYSELACSETTLGLYLNASIFFIVRDILILFSKSFGSFDIRERSVIIHKLDDLAATTNDLYINGNETFNVIAIQRILVLINELQTSLLSKSLEN